MVRHLMNSNLVQRFVGMFNRTNQTFMSTFNSVMDMADETVLKPYEKSVWSYACIRKISENISKTPYILSKTSTRNNVKILQSGELFECLATPNPYMIDMELLDHTLSWLSYRGEAFWMLDRDSALEVPKGIYIFDPRMMEPVYDESKKRLLGWKYYTQEKAYFFTEKNIVHFKTFNPDTPIRGFAPTRPAQYSIDQEYLASVYNKAFFQNGGTVSGWLFVKEELSDSAYKRLLKSFESRHRGARKGHRVGVLEGGTDFKPSNLSHKDMDFTNLKASTKQEILIAFAMSAVVLGEYSDIKSYEGINAAHRTFWHECLIPKIRYIEKVINTKFLKRIDPRLNFHFDLSQVEALREDLRYKLEMSTYLLNLGYTPNQINERLDLNMPKNPWGEYAFFKKGRLPVSSVDDLEGLWGQLSSGNSGNGSDEEDSEGDDDQDNETKGLQDQFDTLEDMVREYAATEAARNTEDEKEFGKLQDACEEVKKEAAEEERIFVGRLRRCFFEKRKEVILELHKDRDILSDECAFQAKLSSICDTTYTNLLTLGRKSVQEQLGQELDTTQDQPEFTDLLEQKIMRTPKALTDTLYTQLKEMAAEDLPKEEALARTRDLFNDILNYSLKAVARVNCVGFLNKVRLVEMELQGVSQHKWIAFAETKGSYASLSGQVSEINAPFKNSKNLETPYAHPGDVSQKANEDSLEWALTYPC